MGQHNRRSLVASRFPQEFLLPLAGLHVGLRFGRGERGGKTILTHHRLYDTADGRGQHVQRVLENVEDGERDKGLTAVQHVAGITEDVGREGGQRHDKGRYDGEEGGESGEVGNNAQRIKLKKIYTDILHIIYTIYILYTIQIHTYIYILYIL